MGDAQRAPDEAVHYCTNMCNASYVFCVTAV